MRTLTIFESYGWTSFIVATACSLFLSESLSFPVSSRHCLLYIGSSVGGPTSQPAPGMKSAISTQQLRMSLFYRENYESS